MNIRKDPLENTVYHGHVEKPDSEKNVEILNDFDGLKESDHELARYIAEKWSDEEKLMLYEEVLSLKGYSAYALDDELVDDPGFRELFDEYLNASGQDRKEKAEEVVNRL